MSFVVALTGGIGCGKSTVAGLFAKHGAGIIDTDAIAHFLTQSDGDGIAAIRATFGQDYITEDGALDRAKMRKLIFSDVASKQRLQLLLHPLILEKTRAQLLRAQSKPYIILVVPLLPESPAFRKLAQRVLVVDCDENSQIARVMGRSRMGEAEVRNIIAQQTPRAERLQLADDIIHNDSSLDNLAEQVAVLHEQYLRKQNSN